jgi:hypothetical protein
MLPISRMNFANTKVLTVIYVAFVFVLGICKNNTINSYVFENSKLEGKNYCLNGLNS